MNNFGIKKISDLLYYFIGKSITNVEVDDEVSKKKSVSFGEKLKIYFSSNLSLEITTDDIPHFYGEGDLELKCHNNETRSS